jgi:glyoxylase-like metal-dependent hydrolase (beta-lactamase superfamily II)
VNDLDFTANAPVHGDLDVRWIHGSPRGERGTDPPFQVHRYDPHTYVLRQSKDLSPPEAPFLYLLFGSERAVLFDTGANKKTVGNPLRETVDELIEAWLAEHREGYHLVVAHTHGHLDHVAADGQFADRPATTVVGRELEAVQEFFGFTAWPDETVRFDLGGGRVLEIIGTPGHHRAAVTSYDPWSGFLLTGDNVLPGRIYAFDVPAYLDSIERTVEFASEREITHVMGCHIEMTRRPGRDYPVGCRYQPEEPPLQMTVHQLLDLRDAARSIEGEPGAHTFDDFLIMNGPSRAYIVPLIARALWAKIRAPRTAPGSG